MTAGGPLMANKRPRRHLSAYGGVETPYLGSPIKPPGRLCQALRVAAVGALVTLACYVIGFLAGEALSERRIIIPHAQHASSSSATSSPSLFDPFLTLESEQQGPSSPSRRGLSVVFQNEYTKDAAADTAVGYGWEVVAEPYRVTTMRAVNGDPGATYEWVVNGHVQGYGNPVDVMFTTVGENNVTVTARGGTPREGRRKRRRSERVQVLTVKVMVRYVRREIRSLTDFDREAFFQAVMTMQRVPMSVGRRLYGARYRDKDYFNRVHLYFGGQQDCDHWHKGPGFVTSHMAMTLEFERSLQAINPRVAMPYWDFTMESTFYNASDWRRSPVFSPDWFGDSAPGNDEHTVSEGRFAYVPTLANTSAYSRVTNPYGLLRAPWNADPTPFMTRSDHVYGYPNNLKPSGCLEYRRSAQSSDWMVLSQRLNSLAHGHIHELMGGSWAHHYADDHHREQSLAIITFAHSIQAMSKEIWRAGLMTCPDRCDPASTPASQCECQCRPEVLADDTHPYEVLVSSGVIDHLFYFEPSGNHSYLTAFTDPATGQASYTLPGLSPQDSLGVYRSIVSTLCKPGHIGDMFQATSTNDITFWVLHPLQERLWHMLRLWEDEHPSSFFPDWRNAGQSCYGHRSGDVQPFRDLWGDGDRRFPTNRQLYRALHPRSPRLTYVYDSFEWAHCRLIGKPVEPPAPSSSSSAAGKDEGRGGGGRAGSDSSR